MKQEKSCGAFIIDNDKVLIVRQKSGNYGFPKGHVEKNETEQETALREVKEETGVDIKIIPDKRYTISYMIDETTNKEVIYYFANLISKDHEKCQESEISEILWININEVEKILTFENIKKLWLQAKQNL